MFDSLLILGFGDRLDGAGIVLGLARRFLDSEGYLWVVPLHRSITTLRCV